MDIIQGFEKIWNGEISEESIYDYDIVFNDYKYITDKILSSPSEIAHLSENCNSDATFLLSRLYFKSLKDDDYCPDSIQTFKRNSNIEVDFNRSHQLLEKTIAQNPRCYQALYELGCDYLGGKSRTQAVARDIKMADKYLSEAYRYANAAEDKQYISLIEAQMKKYK